MCETKRLHAVKHRPELAGEELAKLLVVRHDGGLLLLLLDLWVIKVHHLDVVGVVITSLPRQRVVLVRDWLAVVLFVCLLVSRSNARGAFFLRTWQNLKFLRTLE